MILDFQMHNLTTVEIVEKGLWRVTARADDNLFSAELVLHVKTPALDIREATVAIKRDVLGLTPQLSEATAKLVGVRVGPGMTKIVRAILAEEAGSERVADLVVDSMEMLINALTVAELRKTTEQLGEGVKLENDGPKVFLNDTLLGDGAVKIMRENPRLKDSCAAFRGI